ncbi:recombinase family protein [Streptomyces niveiscabiei]|uniref:recombinase family protein n=1 Tax=Streptomyces niveiscabiei TaxID=164115 RepID=UPI000AA109CF|nr:recombinase family protein [Streptomyces niveiscabiei]
MATRNLLVPSSELYVPQQKIYTPGAAVGDLIPILGYARVSTWRDEMISVDIQKSVVEDAALRRGRFVAAWIVDEDATGRNFRRKIMGGIELVEQGVYAEIWVWKFSRFGRSRYGVALNLARIEQAGGQLLSATEDVDVSTAVGEFTRDMLFAVAAFESNRAGETWKETHELRRSLGLPATGGKRFGYIWHPRRLPDGAGGWTLQDEWYEIGEEEGEVSFDAYDDYQKGKTGFGKVAIWWNELGFLNTRGEPWQDQTVAWYLDSGFAAGLLKCHKPDAGCMEPGRCQKRDHHYFRPGSHQAITDGDTWENYWDRRTARAVTPARALSPVYPLAGLIKCGVCQKNGRTSAGKIHAGNRKNSGYAYRCDARSRHHVQHEPVYIRRRIVEDEVRKWLVEIAAEIDGIAAGRIVLPKPEPKPDLEKKRKRLEKEIARATKGLDGATEAYTLGDVPRDSYIRIRDKFIKERDEVQAVLDALPKLEAEPPSPVPYKETVKGLLKEWDTISVASKRVTLAEVVRRVEIFPNDEVVVVPVWAPADRPIAKKSAARRAMT